MESAIQLIGVLAAAAVLLFIVVYVLVTWLRSRGRPARKDEDGGGTGVSQTESGYWGEADAGVDAG